MKKLTDRWDFNMKPNICTLAHTYDEQKHNPVGWWMSEKLDGMRAIWTGTKLVTRNNEPIFAPEWWLKAFPKDKQLDGELFLGRGKFQKLVSVCRRHVGDDQEWLKVGYLVFDVVENGKPWIERFRVEPAHPIVPVMHYECTSREQLTEFYNSIVDNGGEGVMLRDPSMSYVVGRSWSLLKVKPELELVAKIIGYTEGEGKYTGMVGALICEAGGKQFNVGSGLTDADRTEKYKPTGNITVAYQCLTDSGVPRFPRFIKRIN
jgi:DNA ligase-1